MDDPVLNGSWKRWLNWGQAKASLNSKEANHFGMIQLQVDMKFSSKTSELSVFCLPRQFKTFNQAAFHSQAPAAAAAEPSAPLRSHFSKQLERFRGPWVIRRRSRLWLMPLGGRLLGGGMGGLEGRCPGGGGVAATNFAATCHLNELHLVKHRYPLRRPPRCWSDMLADEQETATKWGELGLEEHRPLSRHSNHLHIVLNGVNWVNWEWESSRPSLENFVVS